MSNEKVREEFEAWCISVGWSVQRCNMDENTYTWGMVSGAWKAWQASRATLCVELPSKINDQSDKWSNGYDFGIDDAQDALEAAEVRCK